MLPAFAPEHRFGFRVFAKQAAIDQRFGCGVNWMGGGFLKDQLEKTEQRARPATKETSLPQKKQKKKEQGRKPCSKNCVDPIFPRKFGFDLD